MEARIRAHNEIDRPEWEAFLLASPQGNVFARPGYMDLIAPGWQAIEVRDQGRLVAVLPLNWRTKYGFHASLQPPFAQCWGLYLAPTPAAHTGHYPAYSWKGKVIRAAVEAIPGQLQLFIHGFSPAFDYALPFHWAGYELRTRYTYRRDLDCSREDLQAGLDKDRQRYVRQAASQGMALRHGSPAELLSLVQANKAAGKDLISGQSPDLLARIIDWSMAEGVGRIWVAEQGGQVAASGFFLQHGRSTTYLLGAQNPAIKSPSAQTLVLFEAMAEGIGPGHVFDFEGSMIQGIEGFFRGMGAAPVPYLYIQKNRLPLWVRWIRKSR